VKKAFSLLFAFFFGLCAAHAAAPKYILLLTCDGFRTDYIEWYQPPHIKQLMADGTRVIHATNVFPTLTTPNMTSLVTGAYPRTTTIAANTEYDRETDEIVHGPRHNKAVTIAKTLRDAGWHTVGVNHFMLKHDVNEYVSPGYDESMKTTDAILKILQSAPSQTFIGVIYGAADHAGHRSGPHSDDVKRAVLGIDAAIGKLIDGLKQKGIYDQTTIAFTADHGMSEFEKRGVSTEPEKALRKAGFRVATAQTELKPDTQIIVLKNGVQLVYFRKATEAERQKATAILQGIKGAEVLDRAALDALGCHNNHSGDLAVSPLPGYTLTGAGKKGGQHGRFPENNPILFFEGAGIKKSSTTEHARNIDVVPTLLHLASVKPAKTVDGEVVRSVLAE
jgi:predicted AlkP superfamily pyrophosphatase or phosphodiesterase